MSFFQFSHVSFWKLFVSFHFSSLPFCGIFSMRNDMKNIYPYAQSHSPFFPSFISPLNVYLSRRSNVSASFANFSRRPFLLPKSLIKWGWKVKRKNLTEIRVPFFVRTPTFDINIVIYNIIHSYLSPCDVCSKTWFQSPFKKIYTTFILIRNDYLFILFKIVKTFIKKLYFFFGFLSTLRLLTKLINPDIITYY